MWRESALFKTSESCGWLINSKAFGMEAADADCRKVPFLRMEIAVAIAIAMPPQSRAIETAIAIAITIS